jgi:hypothetical protein
MMAAEATKDYPVEKNDYRVLMNRIDWVPAYDKEGNRMSDGDGVPLMKPDKVPGTIMHNQPFMIMYKHLKKEYYRAKAMARGAC